MERVRHVDGPAATVPNAPTGRRAGGTALVGAHRRPPHGRADGRGPHPRRLGRLLDAPRTRRRLAAVRRWCGPAAETRRTAFHASTLVRRMVGVFRTAVRRGAYRRIGAREATKPLLSVLAAQVIVNHTGSPDPVILCVNWVTHSPPAP